MICGVMERDARRADPILEGAPVGVFISAREDPSTLRFLCCGRDAPSLSPDAEPVRHYTSCPVWAAGQELDAAERAFAPASRPEPREGEEADVRVLSGAEMTPEERAWLS